MRTVLRKSQYQPLSADIGGPIYILQLNLLQGHATAESTLATASDGFRFHLRSTPRLIRTDGTD